MLSFIGWGKPEKDAALAGLIAQQRERSFRTYGYRRMWLWLKSQNIFRNPKTVLRIMKKYDLLSEIRPPEKMGSRWDSRYTSTRIC